MQTIYDCFSFIQRVSDKSRGGYCTPEDVSTWLDAAQTELFNDYREQWNASGVLSEALKPFIFNTDLTSSNRGILAYPTGFEQVLRISPYLDDPQEYNLVLQNELSAVLTSCLEPIAAYPKYYEAADGIHLLPIKAHTVNINYLKKPNTPVIGYTVSGPDFTYNSGTSTQLDFSAVHYPDIIARACAFAGIALSDADLLTLSQTQSKS